MDKQLIKQKKAGNIHQFFCSLLAIVMISLGIAMIWVILLAPHFNKQLVAPISPFTCQIKAPSSNSKQRRSVPINQQCYKAEDVLALNKALNMSDTLSLLGLLLAVFAFIAPVLSYFTLQKEKQILDNKINQFRQDSENEIISSRKSVKNTVRKNKQLLSNKLTEFKEDSNNEMILSQKTLEDYIISTTSQFPKLLYLTEQFKSRYQSNKLKIPDSKSEIKPDEIVELIVKRISEANDISLRLLLLLEPKSSANQIFEDISNYITETDVSENKPHIHALKLILKYMYEVTYFGTDQRKAALKHFMEHTLKTSMKDFLNDTAQSIS